MTTYTAEHDQGFKGSNSLSPSTPQLSLALADVLPRKVNILPATCAAWPALPLQHRFQGVLMYGFGASLRRHSYCTSGSSLILSKLIRRNLELARSSQTHRLQALAVGQLRSGPSASAPRL